MTEKKKITVRLMLSQKNMCKVFFADIRQLRSALWYVNLSKHIWLRIISLIKTEEQPSWMGSMTLKAILFVR